MIKLANLLTEQKMSLTIDNSEIPLNQELAGLDATLPAGVVKRKKTHPEGRDKAPKASKWLGSKQGVKVKARYSELSSAQDFIDTYNNLKNKLETQGKESMPKNELKFLKYVEKYPYSIKPVNAKNMSKCVEVFKAIQKAVPGLPMEMSGGDDFYHRAYASQKGWHDDSIAMDFWFDFKAKNQEKVERVLLHLMKQYPNLGFINEVHYKSGKATAPHYHISFASGKREAAKFHYLRDANGNYKRGNVLGDLKELWNSPFNKLDSSVNLYDKEFVNKTAEVTSAKILGDGRIAINYPIAHEVDGLGLKFELLYYPDAGFQGPIGGNPVKIKFKNISSTITIDMSRFYGKPNYGDDDASGKFNLAKYLIGLKDGVYQYIMNPIYIEDRTKDMGVESVSEKFILKDGKVINYTTKQAMDLFQKPDFMIGPKNQPTPDKTGAVDQDELLN